MFLLIVFNFRASSTSRQLGPPWDLLYPWLLLTFSWKSLKPLPSTQPTSDPACGSAIWMILLLYGHMAEMHFRTSYNTSTSNILDVGISSNPDGSLHHNIYRKPTHTDRYLNQRSFHHPSIKSSVNHTIVQRTYNLCNPHSLSKELWQDHHIELKPVPINPDHRVSSTQSLTLYLYSLLRFYVT